MQQGNHVNWQQQGLAGPGVRADKTGGAGGAAWMGRLLQFALVLLCMGWAAPWAHAAATVVSVVPDHTPVKAGDTFTLTVTYDSPMDTAVNPVLSFPTPDEDPGGFLSPTSGTWLNATTFQQSYSANLVSLLVESLVDVAVNGAKDAGGGAQQPGLLPDVFEISLYIPPPHVIDMKGYLVPDNLFVSPAGEGRVITDADIGKTVEFIIRFDIPTDYAGCGTALYNSLCLNLVFTNSAGTPLTLTNPTSQWQTRNRYKVTWTIADGDEQLGSINVQIAGGIGRKDDTNNKNVAAELVGVFSIDTRNPRVNALVPSTAVLRSDLTMQRGGGTNTLRAGEIFTLTATFSEPMDTSSTPVFSFPSQPGLGALLTPAGGSWTDSTHYVQSFTVGAGNAVFPAVDVQVTGARDVNGNVQNLVLVGAVFAVQLGVAAAAQAVPALSAWGLVLLCAALGALGAACGRRHR